MKQVMVRYREHRRLVRWPTLQVVFAREVCPAVYYWTLELGRTFTPRSTGPDSIESGHLVLSTFAKYIEELGVIDEFATLFHPGVSEGCRTFRSMFSDGGVGAVRREGMHLPCV